MWLRPDVASQQSLSTGGCYWMTPYDTEHTLQAYCDPAPGNETKTVATRAVVHYHAAVPRNYPVVTT